MRSAFGQALALLIVSVIVQGRYALWCIHTHAALGWDGVGWAALVPQCISMEAFTVHALTYQHSPSHPILAQRVYM